MENTKDFEGWNINKQKIQYQGLNKFYHPRDLWWCALGVNIGFEEDGKGQIGERPVLVLKGFSKQVCLVIPLTTSKKRNKYHIPVGIVDGKESSVIISQLRLVDTKRLINKVGYLNNEVFLNITKAIRSFF